MANERPPFDSRIGKYTLPSPGTIILEGRYYLGTGVVPEDLGLMVLEDSVFPAEDYLILEDSLGDFLILE